LKVRDLSCWKFSPKTQAGYELAMETAQQKTSTIGETLVKPCFLKTVKPLHGVASESKIR